MGCNRLILLRSVLLLAALARLTAAWTTSGLTLRKNCRQSFSYDASLTVLHMGKVKRGKLGALDASDTAVQKSSRSDRKDRKSTISKKKATASDVSPDLAAWVASSSTDDDNTITSSSSTSTASENVEESPSKQSSSRRSRQTVRQAEAEAQEKELTGRVEALTKALENGGDIQSILEPVRQLVDGGTRASDLRQLTAGADQHDFRLAWVGSDDAVCHVGTGLHKVPLARLQEVFLSLTGRNKVQMREIIRILGPFPNVKNTLQGKSSLSDSKSVGAVSWQVTWDSMVDGAGKELLAGKEDNIRNVDLTVYACSPAVIVAVVPPAEGGLRADPLEDNGKHVYVFLREEKLDEQLEALRVA